MAAVTKLGANSAKIVARPAEETAAAKTAAEFAAKAVNKTGEVADQVSVYADGVETGANVMRRVDNMVKSASKVTGMSGGNMARSAGALAGALVRTVMPGPVLRHSGTLLKYAEKIVENPVIKGAGFASIGYGMYKSFTDTEGGTLGKAGAVVASAAVAAAAFSTTVVGGLALGPVVLAAEVLTGGGITGLAKGGMAFLTGKVGKDTAAWDQWKKDASTGEHGWMVQGLVDPAALKESLTGTAKSFKEGASSLMNRGWNLLTAH